MALSPTMTSKLKNRDYANKIRHGSPKLQEVLREVRNLMFIFFIFKILYFQTALSIEKQRRVMHFS